MAVGGDDKKICPFCFGERCGRAKCKSCGMQTSGSFLRGHWKIPAKQVRFHRYGMWYENPTAYPVAFAEPTGYVVFNSLTEIEQSQHLSIGDKINTLKGKDITSIPGFVPANLVPLGFIKEPTPLGPEGFVYGITNSAFPGWVKVGKAYDADARLQNYQTGDPHRGYQMPIKQKVADRNTAEKQAHSKLKAITNYWNGEWFHLSITDVEKIISKL